MIVQYSAAWLYLQYEHHYLKQVDITKWVKGCLKFLCTPLFQCHSW